VIEIDTKADLEAVERVETGPFLLVCDLYRALDTNELLGRINSWIPAD